jgi:primosomal protein N' (replication factor Y)
MAALDGTESTVSDALDQLELPNQAEVLGPVPLDEPRRGPRPGAPMMSSGPAGDEVDGEQVRVRALVRVPQSERRALASSLKALSALRSARKDLAPVRIQVDPPQLG